MRVLTINQGDFTMNIYENIVILNAALSDEEAETALSKIKELIVNQGGEVLKVDIWGRRRLAYEIKKHTKGLYVLMIYKAPSEAIKKVKDFYRIFDAVVKYMIIKLGPKQVQSLEKSEPAPVSPQQKSGD